jgi:hypothetical protein
MNTARLLAICLLFTCFMSYPQRTEATTFAYLIGTDGNAIKIDTGTDTVISTQMLPQTAGFVQTGDTSVVSDSVNKHLFVVAGRQGSKVLVYDLKTLGFVKDMGIYTPEPDITILLTPDRKKIIIVWWNAKLSGGAWQFDIFDGSTLEKIKTLDLYFYPKQVTFSSDSTTLYSIETGDAAKVKVIDMAVFKVVATIDLNNIWKATTFAQGVEDQKNEKLLISESDKTALTDQPKDTLFVYDLKNTISSPRISTAISGGEKISSDGTKIFLNEEQNVWSLNKSYIMYEKSMGKLRVYDVATGKSLGVVPFSVDRESAIFGIHPNGNKVYIVGNMQGKKSLIVIDVANMKVSKTLSISNNAMFMVFYSE